ncbi:hypothetical protein ACFV0D_20985, partial [Streptomyces sp. NPDC059556]
MFLFSSAQIRTPVAWCGLAAVALTAVTSAVTARRLRSGALVRYEQAVADAQEYYAQRESALLGRLADQRATTVWLAEELLPAAGGAGGSLGPPHPRRRGGPRSAHPLAPRSPQLA